MRMNLGFLFLPLLLAFSGCLSAQAHGQASATKGLLAPTPPLGWNSWDSYGTTINEDRVRANALWMKEHLAAFGWQYVVVDMEWFLRQQSETGNYREQDRAYDKFGRYVPAENRFPSAAKGNGFAPLAEYVHSLGLKFGIHILQGIPREALLTNAPIDGSGLRALDAADTSGTCRWNVDNFDLRHNEAGQAYYDSIARLYASWGVDLIKVDCISAQPFKGEEIGMLRRALNKTGRPISLSLSPGEPPIDSTPVMQEHAQQWRISNDVWDLWHSDKEYPQGVGDQFARLAYWNRTRVAGHWPDADMLPLGHLGPAPGWGKARESQLTHAEQRTLVTLWSMFRSPLMMGGDLPATDPWTLSLLTNREVLAVDQHSKANRPVLQDQKTVVWVADPEQGAGRYVAVFNLEDKPRELRLSFEELGLPTGMMRLHDLWSGNDVASASSLTVNLEPHGTVLYRVMP